MPRRNRNARRPAEIEDATVLLSLTFPLELAAMIAAQDAADRREHTR